MGDAAVTVKALDPSQIPANWEDVTPEWMTAAIAGHHPGARVSDVTLTMVDNGTNRRARFGLRYDAGSGPAVVFAKAEGQHREVHARNGNLFNEPDLFASGVPLPVDHPLAYKVIIDRGALDYVIVMEDVTKRGADPRDATRPMTVDQVANGVRGLARLHSHYWEYSGVQYPTLGWVGTWEPTEGYLVPLRHRIPRGLALAAGVVPEAVRRYDAEKIVRFVARFMTSLTQGPLTLLHGDAHIGNTYVLPDDDVGFLDWQVVRRGGWSHDVGYFLMSALTVEDRRSHEAELIEVYRHALEVPNDQRPAPEETWLRYRASPVYGLAVWLATLGADTGAQSRQVCLALCERYAAALLELDTMEALAKLGV
jgi:hypothetical protein